MAAQAGHERVIFKLVMEHSKLERNYIHTGVIVSTGGLATLVMCVIAMTC